MNQTYMLIEYFQLATSVIMTCTVQSGIELRFMERFTGIRMAAGRYILYILLSLALSAAELKLHTLPLSPVLLILRTGLLWAVCTLPRFQQPGLSMLTSITAKTVTLLSTGIITSVTFLAGPAVSKASCSFVPAFWLLFGLLGLILTFVLIIAIFHMILSRFRWQGFLPDSCIAVFFLPVLLILLVEQYIFNQVYGNEVIIQNAQIVQPLADHLQILVIQLMAGFCLLSTLYACRRLTEDYSNHTRLMMLKQETEAQRLYLEEARSRYTQTQSFRHDVRHHLLALNGLLVNKEHDRAREYLHKLEHISETLSFPCRTGNTVVDTVLGSKLSHARLNGIEVECTIQIPALCNAEDTDLCILFSNAVDNAIHACAAQDKGRKYLNISGFHKGGFLMIEFENSCSSPSPCIKGIGLNNIEAVAEKYHGAVTIEKRDYYFRLNVLLVIMEE